MLSLLQIPEFAGAAVGVVIGWITAAVAVGIACWIFL